MNYSIFAAMFADQLEPGQKIKLRFDAAPVTIASVHTLRSGRVIIRHERGASVREGKALIRLEVER